MFDIINKMLHTRLDPWMPIRRVHASPFNAPFTNDHHKPPILKRQKAFHDGGTESILYKFYRLAGNRERKSCKALFYKSYVEHMKARGLTLRFSGRKWNVCEVSTQTRGTFLVTSVLKELKIVCTFQSVESSTSL